VSWYSENGGHWGMSPAYDRPDHPGFSRTISYRCMFLPQRIPEYATRLGRVGWRHGLTASASGRVSIASAATGPEAITWKPHAGKGSQAIRAAIVNPARLDPERQIEVCMQCHLETTSMQFAGGYDAAGPRRLLVSAWRGPGGLHALFSIMPREPAMTINSNWSAPPTDSGNRPVSTPDRKALPARRATIPTRPQRAKNSVAATNRACRSCHNVLIANHPAGRDCVSCHMPQRQAEDAIRITITDHRSSARARQPTGQGGADGIRFLRRRSDALLPRNASALALAIGQVKQLANLPAGLTQLEKVVNANLPADGDAWFEIGGSSSGRGQVQKIHRFLPGGGKAESGKLAVSRTVWVRIENGRLILIVGQCTESFRVARSLRDRSSAWVGIFRNSAESDSEAMAYFRQALAIDPESAPAWNNLSNLRARTGDDSGAERRFGEAVRLQPELSALHVNLGNVLARRGKRAQHELSLRKHSHWFVHGGCAVGMFVKLGRHGQSVKAARGELMRHSLRNQMHEAHNNLGTYFSRSPIR